MEDFRNFIRACLPIVCARRHFYQKIPNMLLSHARLRLLFLHVLKDVQVWSELNIRVTFLSWIIDITKGRIRSKDVDWEDIINYTQKVILDTKIETKRKPEKFIKHKIYREFDEKLFESIVQIATDEFYKIKIKDTLIAEIHCAYRLSNNLMIWKVAHDTSLIDRPDAMYLLGKYGCESRTSYYQEINLKYQQAVMCWLLCAKTFLPSKDMRLYIAKMLWNKRNTGVY